MTILLWGGIGSQTIRSVAEEAYSQFSGCNFGIAASITEGVSNSFFDDVTKPFYKNILARLVEDGIAKMQAYSLWTGSDTKGSVLFGAIDHSKYEGEQLTLVPLFSRKRDGVLDVNFDYTEVPGPDIMVHGMNIQGIKNKFSIEMNQIAIISAGALYSWLPGSMLADLGSALGFVNLDWKAVENYFDNAIEIDGSGLVWNFCSDLPDFEGQHLVLDFSGVKIEVPVNDLVVKDVADLLEFPPVDADGKKICALNLRANTAPYGEGPGSINQEIVFGYPIADKMYIVFDYYNNQAGIAQAIGTSTDSNIEEMTTGIPGTMAALYSTALNTDYTIVTKAITTSVFPSVALIQPVGRDWIIQQCRQLFVWRC